MPGRSLVWALGLWSTWALSAPGADVLVLGDGMLSEYGFCPEPEDGWGYKHPGMYYFYAGLWDFPHRFQHAVSQCRTRVMTRDLEQQHTPLGTADVRVIVLDDVRSDVLAPHAEAIARFVQDGGTLLVVAGYKGLGGDPPHPRFSMTRHQSDYRRTALGPLLPVEISRSPDYRFYPRGRALTARAAGRAAWLAGVPLDTWDVYGLHEVKARGDASVWVTAGRHPLLVEGKCGRGRVLVFTGSEMEYVYAGWHRLDPWPFAQLFWNRVLLHALGRPLRPARVRVRPRVVPVGQPPDIAVDTGDQQRVRLLLTNQQDTVCELTKPGAAAPGLLAGTYWVVAQYGQENARTESAAELTVIEPTRPAASPKWTLPESVVRGRVLQAQLTGRAEKDVYLRAQVVARGGQVVATDEVACHRGAIHLTATVNTAPLRAGEYYLTVRALDDADVVGGARARFWVGEYDRPWTNMFWWGQGQPALHTRSHGRLMRDLKRHHVGLGVPGRSSTRWGFWDMTALNLRYGSARWKQTADKPETKVMSADGKRGAAVCVNDPVFYRVAREEVVRRVGPRQHDPALRLVNIEDELGLPDCYCEDCRALFRKMYGYEMPRPKHDLSPDYLATWSDYCDFKLAVRRAYHTRMVRIVQQVLQRDDLIVLATLPQGFTLMLAEDVLHNTWGQNAVWDHCYPGTMPLQAGMAAHRMERALEVIGHPERPVLHLLQAFAASGRVPHMPPAEYVRNIAWMSFSHGSDHLGWFVFLWMWWSMPGTDAWRGVGEVGELMQRYQPTLMRLTHVRQPLGILYATSQEKIDLLKARTAPDKAEPQKAVLPWRTFHSCEAAWYMTKYAHLPVEFLYEHELTHGPPIAHKAVLIPLAHYLTKPTRQALLKYMAGGGRVYLGQGSTVDLPGAKTVPIRFDMLLNTYFPAGQPKQWQMRRIRACIMDPLQQGARQLGALLAPVVGTPIQVDHPLVVVNRRRGGSVDYLFVVNDAADTPMDDHTFKRRLRLNHFGIVPMRFSRVRPRLCLKHTGSVYDLETRQPVGRRGPDGSVTWTTDLAPGGGRIFALLKRPIARVTVDAPASVNQGEPFTVTGRVESGAAGASSPAVRAVVPVRIRLSDPWRPVKTVHAATHNGQFKATLQTDTTVGAGVGTIEVTELITGKTARRMIRLKGLRHSLLRLAPPRAPAPGKPREARSP